jgi:hypothetical protein
VNFYIVIEGENATKDIYKHWITYVNPQLSYKSKIDDLEENNFVIYAGFGYPYYKTIIQKAIQDVNENPNLDKLVIGVDAEEFLFREKYEEIESILNENHFTKSFSIIIHYFCLETWLLANRKIHSQNINNKLLRTYKNFYNTHKFDPELLPPYNNFNRSQFAYEYFRLLLREKNSKLCYTKNNSSAVIGDKFFGQIHKRCTTTGHIVSFKSFLSAFSNS